MTDSFTVWRNAINASPAETSASVLAKNQTSIVNAILSPDGVVDQEAVNAVRREHLHYRMQNAHSARAESYSKAERVINDSPDAHAKRLSLLQQLFELLPEETADDFEQRAHALIAELQAQRERAATQEGNPGEHGRGVDRAEGPEGDA